MNHQITITIDPEDLPRLAHVNFKVRYYKQSPLIDVTYFDPKIGKLARMSLGRFILNPGSDKKCVYFKDEGQRRDYRKSNLILITRQEYALRKPKPLTF
ncbi:MAG: hypothetical protein K2Q26_06265 [Bdellovibrionales bacterium]|nr:hypothetical protein [Bdellovibrionales bacterium]